MPNVPIELVNAVAERWATLMVTVTLDAALLLLGVGLVWLAIRRRVAPQVGYGLFLLVPLKLLLPVVVPIPGPLAAWTPSSQVQTWFHPVPNDPSPEIRAVRVALSPAPPAPPVLLADRSPAPRRELPAPRPATVTVPTVSIPTVLPVEPTPRLSPASLVMLAWLVGVVVGLIRFGQVQAAFRVRLRRATPIDPSRLAVDLTELCRRAGVRRPVRFVELDSLALPAVWGIWRPTLILPRGIETALQPAQLRWVLLHELAHIERGDLAVALLQRIAAIVHFCNPLVWVANRIINQLREYACDDRATALEEASPVEAGEAFVGVLRLADRSRRGLQGTLGIAGLDSRSGCFQRVNRLLDGDRPIRTRANWPARVALVLVAILVLPHFRGIIAASPAALPPAPAAEASPVPRIGDTNDFSLTVVDPDGKPIPAAVVDFQTGLLPTAEDVHRGKFLKRHSFQTSVQADDSGRIVLKRPAGMDNLVFWITNPGYGPYWGSWASSNHNATIPNEFTARLDRAWRVGSVVVDPEGRPVAGAKVSLSIESKKRPDDFRQMGTAASATTDEQGRWSYSSVPVALGEVGAEIKFPGLEPTVRFLPRSDFGIEPGAEPTSQIKLERGLTVQGKITDDAGRPIAGALIRTEFHNTVVRGETGADGIYQLLGCEPVMTQIVVTAPGRAADFREVKVASDLGSVDFALQPGKTIRVRVLNHEGKPESKARIFFQRWRGQQLYFVFNEINQYADDSGLWTWNEAPSEDFLADICPSGRDGMQLVYQTLTPRDEEYLFRLPAALIVSGTVIDAETKAPIDQFRVLPGRRSENRLSWFSSMAFPATHGAFEYREDRSGSTYLVQIEAPGYRPVSSRDIGWNEGNVALTFELRRATGTRSRVLTPDGRPAVGAKVALGVAGVQISINSGQIDDRSTYAARETTDAEGRFAFPAQAEKYQLVVTHPSGYANVASADDVEPLGEIQLQPWSRVEGTLRVGSELAANVPMQLQAIGEPTKPKIVHISNQYATATDQQGRFVFDRVIPGRGYVGRQIYLTVANGARDVTSSHLVPLDFPPGATVQANLGGTGRAVVGKLLPVPGFQGQVFWNFALVNVQPEQGGEQPTDAFTVTVAPDGTFRIDDVPSGKYLLRSTFDKHHAGSIFRYPFEVPPTGATPEDSPVDLGAIQLVTPAIR